MDAKVFEDHAEHDQDYADYADISQLESMPPLDPNYEVFMKWPPEPIVWRSLYEQFIMMAEIR